MPVAGDRDVPAPGRAAALCGNTMTVSTAKTQTTAYHALAPNAAPRFGSDVDKWAESSGTSGDLGANL
ncbi:MULTISPECIES: hypothetical protein [unclassified Streptomyces]|uniref:hypothetical protein n=1 Tax=unclassified Streptomyces TaxID=2593676 RepID=UPI000B80E3A6|nr:MULTISPECIES: hypothetical protein [unclassified Streptomyces]